MKKTLILLLLLAFLAFSCKNSQNATETKTTHHLVFVASTPDSLLTSESVYYYKDKDLLFVSCINGMPTDKDSNGYISQIDKNGKILNLRWITGLNAPKGMGVFQNKLYVTDIDRIAIIDIPNAEIIKIINVDGAKFLNDIAIDSAGNVYISDSQNNLVYMLQNDSIVGIFAQDLNEANGLYIQNGKLLVGCKDRLAAVDLNTKTVSTIAKVDTKMIDGLKPADGGYITSDWYGKVYFLDTKNDTIYAMLNFPAQKKNAADIEYIPGENLVFVPTFFDNRVEIYKFN